MVKIVCLDDAFSEIFQLEASPVEGQSLPPKKEKKKKERRKKLKNEKPQDKGHLEILISVHARTKMS